MTSTANNDTQQLRNVLVAGADDPPRSFDVLICGAGLAGTVQAVALAQCVPGLSIALADPKGVARPNPRNEADPRATAISEASRQMLLSIGVWPLVEQVAQPMHRIKLTDSSPTDRVRPVALAFDNHVRRNDQTLVPAAYVVPNALLESAAARRLQELGSIQVLHERIRTISVTPSAVEVTTDGGRRRCRLLIAADGARSPIRKLAGFRTTTTQHGQSAILTILECEVEHQGTAVQHFLPSGPMALLPMTENRLCITWTLDTPKAERMASVADSEFEAELLRYLGGSFGRVRLASTRALFPLASQVSHALARDRVALVGDSAHAVHPIAGQGLNLAFRDVAALTECIADGVRAGLESGDGEILARYQRWRRFDSVSSATAFASLNALFASDWVLLRSARVFGLGLVDRLPMLKRMFVAEAAGTAGAVPRLMRGDSIASTEAERVA